MPRRLLAALLLGTLIPVLPARAEDPARPGAVSGSAEFALALYERVRGEGRNVFFSPYSVRAAFAMARQGARGETARQMDEVLRLPSDAASAFEALDRALVPPDVPTRREGEWVQAPAYELSPANALWLQQGYEVAPSFLEVLRKDFGAGLERLDFGETERARRTINAWVEERTRERIRDLIPEGALSPITRLVLTNAIYMKAAWTHPFSERNTREEPFFLESGQEVRVPLMRRSERYRYAETDEAQILELGYQGDELAMVVVLPSARDGLGAVEEKLDEAALAGWMGELAPRTVDVTLPRFEVTQPMDLGALLQSMGLEDAFSPERADFSGITTAERLFIGAALHKAFIKVDEEGTEAAAATALVMKGAARPPEPREPVVFRADHPFLYLVVHRPTGAILFMGRLADPS